MVAHGLRLLIHHELDQDAAGVGFATATLIAAELGEGTQRMYAAGLWYPGAALVRQLIECGARTAEEMVTSSSTCAEHSVRRSILPSPAAAVRLSAERSAEVPMSLAPAAREADCRPSCRMLACGLRSCAA